MFYLGQLCAAKGSKDGVKLTWSEGMHRLGAVIQALTGSKIRETDGIITAPELLTRDDYLICGLKPKYDLCAFVQEGWQKEVSRNGSFHGTHN